MLLKKSNFLIAAALAFFFFVPLHAHAAFLDPFKECSDTFDACGLDLDCFSVGVQGSVQDGFDLGLAGAKKQCLPQQNYSPCGENGSCGNGKTCVVVQSLYDKTKYEMACVDQALVPKELNAPDVCQTDKKCDIGKQCVRVIGVLDEKADKQVAFNQCIPNGSISLGLLNTMGAAGVCGENATCDAEQYCVENSYDSGNHVCYKKSNAYTDVSCDNVGAPCGSGATQGTCLNTIDGNTKVKRCLNVETLPFGPNAPSSYFCKTDADCTKDTVHKFCLMNPATQQSQCFAQSTILTDMSSTDKKCLSDGTKSCSCATAYQPACSPDTAESICVSHNGSPLDSVCIKYVKGGAALTTGAAYEEQPPAQERDFRTAPHLEIDVPNLNLAQKIMGTDATTGRTFSVPYLAQYLRAAIRYMIGFGVLLAVIMLMFAGFRWMTSFGNVKAVKTAQEMLSNSVLGLALLLGSYTLLYVINPELVNFKSLEILAPKQQLFEATSVGADVMNEQADDVGTAEAVDDPKSHKSSVGVDRKLSDEDITAAAVKGGVDTCLLWSFVKKESGGQLHAIGHDENYRVPNKPVSARKTFLLSGKKASGAEFTAATEPWDNSKNSQKDTNDDKFDPTKPPNYGLDWRFSHGIGFMQLTIFPTKNNAAGKQIVGPNGPEWARRVKGKWYTITDLLNADTALDASIQFMKKGNSGDCSKKSKVLDAMRCMGVSNAAMARALTYYQKCPLQKTLSVTPGDFQNLPTNSH